MAVALFKEPPLPRPALAFSGGFAFLSDDVSGVTAYDVMGECEQTECEAGQQGCTVTRHGLVPLPIDRFPPCCP